MEPDFTTLSLRNVVAMYQHADPVFCDFEVLLGSCKHLNGGIAPIEVTH
jgi:hypothetical protein